MTLNPLKVVPNGQCTPFEFWKWFGTETCRAKRETKFSVFREILAKNLHEMFGLLYEHV